MKKLFLITAVVGLVIMLTGFGVVTVSDSIANKYADEVNTKRSVVTNVVDNSNGSSTLYLLTADNEEVVIDTKLSEENDINVNDTVSVHEFNGKYSLERSKLFMPDALSTAAAVMVIAGLLISFFSLSVFTAVIRFGRTEIRNRAMSV